MLCAPVIHVLSLMRSNHVSADLRASSDHLLALLPPVPGAAGKLPLEFCLLTAWLVRCMQSS
jgi:hypothetical protein